MKKNLKKALAISILSMGVLSSAPTALYASGGVNRTNGNNGANVANGANRQPRRRYGCIELMVTSFYLNRNDFVSFLGAFEERGGDRRAFKINPVGISSLKDIREYLPNIETFEDYHQLTPGENRNNHVNSLNEGHIKTLIYYPGSFDLKRFHDILKANDNIENDLRRSAAQIKVIKDYNFKRVPALCGKEWARIVYPFNGKYFRVEYIKGYDRKYLNDPRRRRIVFLFSPLHIFNNTPVRKINRGENAFDCFNRLMNEDYGFKGFVKINDKDKEKFKFPDGIKRIRENAFLGCNTFKEIEIPDGVTEIGEGAFYDCNSLEKIGIPNSVKEIKEETFYNCTSLKEVDLPDSLEAISESVFENCTSLEKINIPDNVEFIGEHAFTGCGALKEIKIPNNTDSIEDGTFADCTSLEKVEIPESVKQIGNDAFNGCNSLKEINIPDNVGENDGIGYDAFAYCSKLKKFEFPYGVEKLYEGVLYGCESLEEITIPDSVTEIEEGAISECTSLKKIIIPNSVKKIHRNVFNGCASLETITYNGRDYHSVREFLDDFKALDGNSLTVY